MLEFEAKPFVEAIRMLTILDTLKIDNPGEIIDDEVCTTIIKHYERLQECCDALGAPLTKKSAIRAVRHLKKGGATAEKIQDYTREARSRLIDELEAAKLFALRHDVGKYYASAEDIFGAEVVRILSDALDNLEEAGKCLALSRATASVFHLMRALEYTVQQVGIKLGATVKDADGEFLTWGVILANIDDKIKKMSDKDESEKWSAIRAQLYHVNKATRTPTMHPKNHYSVEQATELMEATRPFLRDLVPMLE